MSSNPKQKITDGEKFRGVAKEDEDKTQAQMAQLWEGDISSHTMARAVQKLGLTRKKRRMGIASGTKRSVPNSDNT